MTNIIQGPYFHDIQSQPQALAATFTALDGLALPHRLRKDSPLILTGMGASLHVLIPLQLQMIAAGLLPLVMETSELIHHASALLRPGAVVVAVSQSGRSAETVRLLERMPEGVQVVGVTNDEASPLAQHSHVALLTRAGPEATVSCKTYVTSLMVLHWLGSYWAGDDLAAVRAELATASDVVSAYLRDWPRHVVELTHTVLKTSLLYYCGRGPSLAAARAAGLITKEAVRFPAEGLSSAAFRHGPLEMVGPDVLLVVFEGLPQTSAINARLVEDVMRRGGRAVLCGPSAMGPLKLPHSSSPVLAMLEIVAAQMITLALAATHNHEAGHFAHAAKVTEVE